MGRKVQDIKEEFDKLCDEQERLYKPEFEAVLIASNYPQQEKQVGGWHFVPISILIPKGANDIQEALTNILLTDAKEGKGLFENTTNILQEDEVLDEFLCVEPYDCKREFASFYRELQKFNVVGTDTALLDQLTISNSSILNNGTRLLFATLKRCGNIIKDNTDSPNKTRNELKNIIESFDDMPVWGLLFQILMLEGLKKMLENLTIDEAQALSDWLVEILLDKEMLFCVQYYGDGDLKIIKPICEYLCTTETGKVIQEYVRKEYYSELQSEQTTDAQSLNQEPEPQQELKNLLPDILKSGEAVGVFQKAIDTNLIGKNINSLIWNNTKQLLAYFAEKMSSKFKLSSKLDKDGKTTTNWKTFEMLFNVKDLKGAKHNWMRLYTRFEPTGFEKVDALFE